VALGSGPLLPFGLFPLTVSVATDNPRFPTVPTTGLVPGAFCFSLAARFTGSTDMAAVEPPEGTEGSFRSFRQSGNSHLLGVIGFRLLGGRFSVVLERRPLSLISEWLDKEGCRPTVVDNGLHVSVS